MSASPAPDSPRRDWREAALIAVAVALMVVSISGQVQVLEPYMGVEFALLYAGANDFGAILALDALMTAPVKSSIRKWAWVAILLAATPGAMLNAWHVMHRDSTVALPTEMGLVVGVEPIALLLVLSHLIGLVVAGRRAPAGATSTSSTRSTSTTRAPAPAGAGGAGGRPAVAPGGHQVTKAAVGTSASPGGHQVTVTTPTTTRPPAAAPRPPAAAPAPALPAAPARSAVPVRALAAVPDERLPWMTDALLDAVLTDLRKARAKGEVYGRPRLKAEHDLNENRAKDLLAYVKTHRLLEAS